MVAWDAYAGRGGWRNPDIDDKMSSSHAHGIPTHCQLSPHPNHTCSTISASRSLTSELLPSGTVSCSTQTARHAVKLWMGRSRRCKIQQSQAQSSMRTVGWR